MTDTADTLAAARRWTVFHDEDGVWRIVAEADGADVTWPEMDEADCQRAVDEHNAILAAIPPDPRLDALTAAVKYLLDQVPSDGEDWTLYDLKRNLDP
jgi:hypothetical protein